MAGMPHFSHRGRLCLALSSFALVGCSPMCLLEVVLEGPGATALSEEKLHVTGVKACPPAPVNARAPGPGSGDVEYVRTQPVPRGVDVTAAFRGRHCRVQVTAWYDANGNELADAGDWVGSSAALDIRDEGWFGDNSAQAGKVTLEAWQ